MSSAEEHSEVIKLILGILAVLLNGILILAMIRSRKHIFVTRISYMVGNLALTDLLIGLSLIFVEPTNLKHKDTPKEFIEYKLPLIWGAMLVSFLTIFFMSIDRLVVIVLPISWTNILTVPRTICCLIFIWICGIVSGVALNYKQYITQFILVMLYEICILFFIAIHIYILKVLRKQKKVLVQSESTAFEDNESPSPRSNHSMHAKVTTVVCIIFVVFVFTFIPNFLCLQIFASVNIFDVGITFDVEAFLIAYNYTDALSYINFIVNPIIYAWRLRMYRKALRGLIKCLTV